MTTIKPAPAKWFLIIKDTTHELTLDELKAIAWDIDTILQQQFGEAAPVVTFVCEHLKVSMTQLLTKKRSESGWLARWCVFYLLQRKGYGPSRTARLFGVKPWTVMGGLKTLQDRIDTEPLKYQWLVQKAA